MSTATPPAPSSVSAPTTADSALQSGFASLARRDYATAEIAARQALADPRTASSSTNASYLLAQALAGKGDWARAAVAYDDTYNRSRTGAHAHDSLLGVAVALTKLNERPASCEALERLRADFPSPREDLRDIIASTRQQAGCP